MTDDEINSAIAEACAGGGGSATPTNVQIFTSSGTWTKPVGAKLVQVTVVGAGGGGGGFAMRTIDASLLGYTEHGQLVRRSAEPGNLIAYA